MVSARVVVTLCVFLAGSAGALAADTPEPVIIPGDPAVAGRPTLNAWLLQPKGVAKAPAIVAMHGCAGVTGERGALLPIYGDWGERLVGQGYTVLFVDSFGSRGFRQQCTQKPRQVVPKERGEDALAAAAWLAKRSDVDASRLALMGWSHGGSTTLWAVDARRAKPEAEFKTAIAFYPGCSVQAKQAAWATRVVVLSSVPRRGKNVGRVASTMCFSGSMRPPSGKALALRFAAASSSVVAPMASSSSSLRCRSACVSAWRR